jgi:thymidylate kinase
MFSGAAPDAMERRPLDFHRRVRALFRELPTVYPKPIAVIDAARDPDAIFAAIQEELRRAFP